VKKKQPQSAPKFVTDARVLRRYSQTGEKRKARPLMVDPSLSKNLCSLIQTPVKGNKVG